VAPSWRLRQVEVEDGRVDVTGCVGPFYPKIAIFYVLGTRGNLVFSLLLGPIIDISYAAPQAHRIVKVALHRVYSLGIIFIFS
jgi:hypothetical protein